MQVKGTKMLIGTGQLLSHCHLNSNKGAGFKEELVKRQFIYSFSGLISITSILLVFAKVQLLYVSFSPEP